MSAKTTQQTTTTQTTQQSKTTQQPTSMAHYQQAEATVAALRTKLDTVRRAAHDAEQRLRELEDATEADGVKLQALHDQATAAEQHLAAAREAERMFGSGELASYYSQRVQEREDEVQAAREAVETAKAAVQSRAEERERERETVMRALAEAQSAVQQLSSDISSAEATVQTTKAAAMRATADAILAEVVREKQARADAQRAQRLAEVALTRLQERAASAFGRSSALYQEIAALLPAKPTPLDRLLDLAEEMDNLFDVCSGESLAGHVRAAALSTTGDQGQLLASLTLDAGQLRTLLAYSWYGLMNDQPDSVAAQQLLEQRRAMRKHARNVYRTL